MAKTVAGTPGYIAPEILQQRPYDHRCDYWSLGVVLYLLLSGSLPFEHHDHIECFAMIMKGKFSMKSETWTEHISDEAKSLIEGLLVVDPNMRFNAE
jgi:serine/threonine protein kinase